MRAVYRVADVRAAEQRLMATLPPGTLMQRAATGLARRCALSLSTVYGSRVLLLVGSGDNGGDALYAGALLAKRGAQVSAVLTGKAHAEGLATFKAAGGRVLEAVPASTDLIVDGLVGIGATGPLREPAKALIAQLPKAPVIAVDVPSGVDVDTGDVPGPAIRADITVTFGCLKPALVVGKAVPYAGQVELVDIGLEPWIAGSPALQMADAQDIAEWWPHPGPESDKYTRGVVGLATGSANYPGAAWLSAAGALAGPTGLIRYAGRAHELIAEAHPSVVVSARAADALRVQAWVCGCGLGTDAEAQAELRAVLAAPVPVILDADAITMLVDGSMSGVLRSRDAPTILTPHDREYTRLAGESPGPDRVAAALKLAVWTKSTIVLKGHRTVIASPNGEAWVNPTGSSALATGGTGDVLAGLMGSVLAAGVGPMRAAVMASYVHGQAGRLAALDGPVTAVDVAAALRPVLANLLA
ncbi:MAG TPA: bifunctional ADP-dependent NAD(P)H-hydrate dehydratase/NAD(P)H-hydrate epimerase [Micromonosporaceae bacterium]|nr:bifunctional ADP-dependent NAD(P)H-hydrate dehydratase/NAD(P)H-hydrate epimerase [Micromonosporaceae bacterium]HCU50598.1 bifunctional ADP-dependent NAD(P)H-hydrate dehydratase/NAD(P)H-hydrate epimerase [Micromonosporaceae bacterium]